MCAPEHVLKIIYIYIYILWVSLVAQLVKNLPAMQETRLPSPGWEDPLEKGTATHSSILAWRTPRTVYCIEELYRNHF